MLQKLAEEIAECYQRASEARERAKRTGDQATKQDFVDMEGRWLSLAHSYEFAERLSGFTDEVKRRLPRNKK
jgi:hypothetical protein